MRPPSRAEIPATQIRALADDDYILRSGPVVLIGDCGTGKTHLFTRLSRGSDVSSATRQAIHLLQSHSDFGQKTPVLLVRDRSISVRWLTLAERCHRHACPLDRNCVGPTRSVRRSAGRLDY
jgi:hypothetical protein